MEEEFFWKCEPEAEAFLEKALKKLSQFNSKIEQLSHSLEMVTSSRLFDWLDYIQIEKNEQTLEELIAAGFTLCQATANGTIWRHEGAQLPFVILNDENYSESAVAIHVESIEEFLLVRGLDRSIEGSPFSPFRRSVIDTENNCSLVAVERRGALPLYPTEYSAEYTNRYIKAKQLWQTRQRNLDSQDEAMDIAIECAEKMVKLVDVNAAAWIILEVERSYWQARNTAAQLQKNRQDRLGMGWANHDHHTFRSSRSHFSKLVRLFEVVGFKCRERFYAGKEAGWGAQVMENKACGLILFLDVDLSAEEIKIDFAHKQLPELDRLGTIGLWCGLHGDSILKSGMHHLEAQFLFEKLREDLSHLGVRMMDPFSSFSYLKQAFTAGEIWAVEPKRIDKLFQEKKITESEAHKFRSQGAVGSHLENLQRREGYKGVNQTNVSYIIKKTDPRLAEQDQ